MKHIMLFTCLIFAMSGCIGESGHPRIYITDAGKDAFTSKLKSVDWAQESYDKLKSNVDPYVDRHQTDPEWITSRLQMYWDTHYERIYVKGSAFTHGTGRAPVPTVKFAGHRDGATDYLMPSIEDTQPYMDEKGMYLQNRKKEGQPWEWVHPSKTGRMIGPMNERILSLAADAAFLYWYTAEEKYAVFASDIFLTYVKGMYYRREPFALEDYSNSHLMGLATFEVILDHMIPYLALSYDFLHGYLKRHDADFDMIAEVFKRFADQQILYGVPDNNWNIFQARHVTYLALALEDDAYYRDGRGRQYYLNEIMNHTTIRQFALKEVIGELFDPQTGLWPESATYSMSVCNDMLDIVCLIDNAENNHLLDTFPVLKKAVPATVEYLFPNGRVTAFGDARYVPLNPRPFEMLISLYRKYGENEQEKELTQVLRKMIDDGVYSRSDNKSMFSLFFHVDKLADIPAGEAGYDHLLSDTYYAPNVSWLIQRNGRDRENGMAVTLTGAFGNHAHANGISMEMYGKGLMLAPESSYGETYGTRDNQEYYARFPAHNTVIVDGMSDYGWMRSNYPYRLLSVYPAHGESLLPYDRVTFSRVELIEPRTDARQERLTGIVRTADTAAYAVDIFRSARNDRKDVKHEYFYHSTGQSIDIMNANGQKMPLSPTQELSSAAGDLKGYDYFQNKKAVSFDGNFTACFHIKTGQQEDVSVNMWMKGYQGRTIFTAEAPKSNAFVKGSVPDELLGKPLPTLVVRQKGEAWNRPFAAVYHPYASREGSSVRSVEYFGNTGDFIGITV
ncbi:MAG: six-hairpin glycosidase, partial [Tannerellaceae bacterium]|nr:six-hairpin glycosidase [Tannerellaceae bacterium]